MKHAAIKKIHKDYQLTYSGRNEGRNRVDFALNPQLALLVEKITLMNERNLSIDVKLLTGSIQVHYAPQQERAKVERKKLL